MTEQTFMRHGRKFVLATLALILAFVITLIGFSLFVIAPASSAFVVQLITQFTITITVITGGFAAANTAIEKFHVGAVTSPSPEQ